QRGEPARGHLVHPTAALELQPAGDPSPDLPRSNQPPVPVVEHAPVPVQQPARGRLDDVAERSDPVAQRHPRLSLSERISPSTPARSRRPPRSHPCPPALRGRAPTASATAVRSDRIAVSSERIEPISTLSSERTEAIWAPSSDREDSILSPSSDRTARISVPSSDRADSSRSSSRRACLSTASNRPWRNHVMTTVAATTVSALMTTPPKSTTSSFPGEEAAANASLAPPTDDGPASD